MFFVYYPNEKQRLHEQLKSEDNLVFQNPHSIWSHVR